MNHEQMNHDAMSHSDMAVMDADALRDPHAYSGGYERASGPYALASQRQVVLADEATFVGVWMDRFEFVDHGDGQGTEMEGFAWLGNSYRRLLLQTQIETVGGEVEEGEVDLLYSRAVSPFWDIRGGLHHSFGENADRDWATIGFKGLVPYWFEVDAALHLGNKGRTAFDLEVEYELLLTQRLVLQPRIDIKAFSQKDIELGRGSGLSTIKAGARLRYEFDRQFAPYLGVERVKRFGETADLLPLSSSRMETHWVLGLRFWY
jgi:copper resistance protein B